MKVVKGGGQIPRLCYCHESDPKYMYIPRGVDFIKTTRGTFIHISRRCIIMCERICKTLPYSQQTTIFCTKIIYLAPDMNLEILVSLQINRSGFPHKFKNKIP